MTPFLSAFGIIGSVWFVLLFSKFIVVLTPMTIGDWFARIARLGSSFMLVILGWVIALNFRESAPAPVFTLIAVGMTLGFIGDLFMARQQTIGGIIAFGAGHIVYITALLQSGDRLGLPFDGPRLAAWGLWLLVGFVGWFVVVLWGLGRSAGKQPSLLHFAALPYALLLASTAGMATGLAVLESEFWPVAAGAALFLFSDLLIAGRLFSGLKFRFLDDLIWYTYGPGQLLIVAGMFNAWQILASLTA